MADLTRFSIAKNGFKVDIVDEGLVAAQDGDGFNATSPCFRIVIRHSNDGTAFTEANIAFTSKVIHDDDGFWSWSNAEKEVEEAAQALIAKDVINLIDYDTYQYSQYVAPAPQVADEAYHC
ncbi:MAG: hypothetical protein ACJAXJ_001613 [Colwellia sp.]|jgi:hypothetical protein